MPNNIKYAAPELNGFIYKSHNGAYKQANFIARELGHPAYTYSIPRDDGSPKKRQLLVTGAAVRPPGGVKLWSIRPLERGVGITWDWTDDVDERLVANGL